MNIAVCDDEKQAALQLKTEIMNVAVDTSVDVYENAFDLLNLKKSYDMIFLDIQMPNLNGMELAKKLRDIGDNTLIVFVTAIKDYVFDAFDVKAYNYLIKPINTEKLRDVLNRGAKEISDGNNPAEIKESDKHIYLSGNRVFIKTRWNNFCIDKDDICYVESQRKKCIVYTFDKQIECYSTITGFEELLGSGFFRCHRGYLVNLGHIDRYTSDTITLTDGRPVYLSKNRYTDFVKAYMKFLR